MVRSDVYISTLKDMRQFSRISSAGSQDSSHSVWQRRMETGESAVFGTTKRMPSLKQRRDVL